EAAERGRPQQRQHRAVDHDRQGVGARIAQRPQRWIEHGSAEPHPMEQPTRDQPVLPGVVERMRNAGSENGEIEDPVGERDEERGPKPRGGERRPRLRHGSQSGTGSGGGSTNAVLESRTVHGRDPSVNLDWARLKVVVLESDDWGFCAWVPDEHGHRVLADLPAWRSPAGRVYGRSTLESALDVERLASTLLEFRGADGLP